MELTKFLKEHKTKEGEITHTNFLGGKYNIEGKEYEKFLEIYFNELKKGNEDLYLIERNSKIFKFYADIDFDDKTKVEMEYINKIVNIYKSILNTDEVIISIRTMNKIHLNFPNIRVDKNGAKRYRDQILSQIKDECSELIEDDKMWDKIIDKSVYNNGGLRMFGSKKKKTDEMVYKIYNIEEERYEDITYDIFRKTCIRIETEIINEDIIIEEEPEETEETEETDEKIEGIEIINEYIRDKCRIVLNSKIEINKVKYIGIKSISVSLKNKTCPFVGGEHKRSIDSNNSPLYILVNRHGSSLRCYNEECEKKWTPKQLIKLSNDMKKLLKIDINEEYLIQSLTMTHYDVSKYIFEKYKNKYMIEGVKNGDEWYEFDGNNWKKSINLWNEMTNDIINDYEKYIYEDDAYVDNVNKLIYMLKSVNYKNALLKECGYIFKAYDVDFVKKLDENGKLLCCANGIIDLSGGKAIFREGRFSDYVTLNTGIEYREYKEDNKEVNEVLDFLGKVFVDEEIRDYVLKTIASSILGINDEHFHIWTGVGSNGKSTMIKLIEETLGEYACRVPVSLLTQKRGLSSNASPEVIRMKGRRFVSMQEPESGEELKVGLLKELTGRDKIVARDLYKTSTEFLPQFKIFLCCNDLPNISADDYGTWRRLRVVEYKSKFVNEPKDSNKHEFKKDSTLYMKMSNWKEAFLSILVKYYNNIKDEGIIEPQEVMKYTNQYKVNNDMTQLFVESELIEDKMVTTSLGEIWEVYIDWCKSSGIKSLTRVEFNKKMRKNYKEKIIGGIKGINFRIRDNVLEEE